MSSLILELFLIFSLKIPRIPGGLTEKLHLTKCQNGPLIYKPDRNFLFCTEDTYQKRNNQLLLEIFVNQTDIDDRALDKKIQ